MSGPDFRRGNTKTMRKKGGIEEGRGFFFQICCGKEEDRERERKRERERERERERVNE